MVQTLTTGWQLPERGDKGDPVFDALEFNINQLDTHKHDGSDSTKIPSSRLNRSTVSVPSTGWTADGNLFKQTVSLPLDYTTANESDFGNVVLQFFFSGGAEDGEQCFPKTVKLTATTFELHSPVNNQAFTVALT